MKRLVPSMAAILALASLLALGGAGCTSAVPASHTEADRAFYTTGAPYARLGVSGRPVAERLLWQDTDRAWRRQCGWAPTETACPGGPDDPLLVNGLPK